MDRDKPTYFHYWGKAAPTENQSENHHLLVYHSLDVAAVGEVLLSKHETLRQRLAGLAGFADEMVFKQWIVFFLALHDLGKFAESFQNLKPDLLTALQQVTSERQYGIRHDSLGYMLWRTELKTWFSEIGILPRVTSPRSSGSTQAADYWIQAVTGHHGQPPEGVSSHRLNGIGVRVCCADSWRGLPRQPVLPTDNIKSAALIYSTNLLTTKSLTL